jgi:hypothetical protein
MSRLKEFIFGLEQGVWIKKTGAQNNFLRQWVK